jgi:hypothetical protein
MYAVVVLYLWLPIKTPEAVVDLISSMTLLPSVAVEMYVKFFMLERPHVVEVPIYTIHWLKNVAEETS